MTVDQQKMLDGFAAVTTEVLVERQRQIALGWTPAHDESHSRHEWAWLIAQHLVVLMSPLAVDAASTRIQLLEIAALAIAAIESWDRAAK